MGGGLDMCLVVVAGWFELLDVLVLTSELEGLTGGLLLAFDDAGGREYSGILSAGDKGGKPPFPDMLMLGEQ